LCRLNFISLVICPAKCLRLTLFILLYLLIYYSGNQIDKNEMGAACSTYGGKERCI
jgi:hypothetical protein